MRIRAYAKAANALAIYPNRGSNIEYPALGLAGEAGEIANKVKKIQRDNHPPKDLLGEIGDVLWYLNACSEEIAYPLPLIAQLSAETNRANYFGQLDDIWRRTEHPTLEEAALNLAHSAGLFANFAVRGYDIAFVNPRKMLHAALRRLALVAHAADHTLEDAAAVNLAKLEDRAERSALQGSGDQR